MDLSEWLVLLIDDETDIREMVCLVLEDAGYTVIDAPSGRAGIDLCAKHHPQLVITDIRMPGMDGLEVLAAIKAQHPQTEVIVATGYAEMAVAVRALQLDASDFITKPIDDGALLIALERARKRYRDRRKLRDYSAFLAAGWAGTSQVLQTAYRYQKNLIESSLDGILGCDEEGRVVMVNQRLEQLLGRQRDLLVGRVSLPNLLTEDEVRRFHAEIRDPMIGGVGRLPIFETCITFDVVKIPVQLSAVRLMEAGQPAGVVCFVRDLRELRRLEQALADHTRLLHQDKMLALGRLAASVVHEINNPLAGVLNYLKLMDHLLGKGKLDPKGQETFRSYLELVITETERCSRIVSNLLAFSRKSPLNYDLVDLPDVLQRCVMLSHHKLSLHSIKLHTRWNKTLPAVWGDANQLQQCVVNLVFNAIDAMPSGGDLYLEAFALHQENAVVIEVRDTGGGIAPEDQPHVFEPFYTTKPDGAGIGLGLSTTFGILERHQGRLTIEASSPEGTTIRIRLPQHSKTGTQAPATDCLREIMP